jgi:hypothetical protein
VPDSMSDKLQFVAGDWTFETRQPAELRQFHVPLITSLHFTPDGVSGPRHAITKNIALLTEGKDKLQFVVDKLQFVDNETDATTD